MIHANLPVGTQEITTAAPPQSASLQNGNFFRAVFDQIEQFALILQPDGMVMEANQAALDIVGLKRADAVNRPLWEFAPEGQAQLQEGVRRAAGGRLFRGEMEITGQNGQTVVIEFSIKPLHDNDGKIAWLLAQGSDITYLKETEARLEESQALLSEAQRAVYLGKMKARRRTQKTTGALRAANVALTETLDLAAVLETLLDYLDELAPCDSNDILLRANSANLVLYAQRGYELRPAWLRVRVAAFGHLETVINGKESLRINDTQTYPDWRHHFTEAREVRSWLGIPLMVGGQVIGLCSLNHSEPDHFNDECQALAETLVAQAAIAIQNARWFTELRTSREQLRELAKRIVTVQEEERRRVSRELHDEAGQSLTALKLSLEMIHAELPPALETIDQSLAEAIELTDETMERIRRLAHGLRPPALDALGLHTALEGLCCEFANRAGLEMVYEGCELPRLPDTLTISLYRFAQEALTNVIKHANANRVEVSLWRQGDQLCLMVADDGRGLPTEERPPTLSDSSGLGLVGMTERLMLLGGQLKIESQPGEGTRLTAYAPLPALEEAA